MGEPLKFAASLAFPATAIRIMGDGGYVVSLYVPEDELGAMMQLALLRQRELDVTVIDKGAQPAKQGKRKKKVPEWGDDDTNEGDSIG